MLGNNDLFPLQIKEIDTFYMQFLFLYYNKSLICSSGTKLINYSKHDRSVVSNGNCSFRKKKKKKKKKKSENKIK